MGGVASGWLGVGEGVVFLCTVQYLNKWNASDTVCNAWKCYCLHHMTSVTFQGGHRAMFLASRRVIRRARRFLHYSKQPTVVHCYTSHRHTQLK